MPYPQEPTTAPSASAYAADPPRWWQRKPTPLAVAVGAAAALALAILIGLLLTPSMERSHGENASRGRSAAVADGLTQFDLRPARGAYQPPSVNAVNRAYLAVQTAFGAGGVSELAHQGVLCFQGLERKPSYELLDYCLAFDEFAAALTARVAQGEQPSPASWFGSAGARHLNTARAVMGGQGDADARLLDLRRMVAQRSGDIGRLPLPPERRRPAQAVPTIAPAPPVEAPPAPRRTPEPPPERLAIPAQTLEPSPRVAPRALPQLPPRPQPQPAAPRATQEVGAGRSVSPVPSFNCRYARTRSEQMVCADPDLAAADRRLNRAYREAIGAGTPEGELRRAQDRWLAIRERGASDKESLGAVYERRIQELEALAR